MGMISQSGGGVPVGAELPFHGGTVPDGFLLMYGQTVNIADYPALYLVLGTTHGGDGVTTFGIPDSRGRITAGRDDMGGTPANRITTAGSGLDGASLGAVGGGESVTLDEASIPAHRHTEKTVNALSGATTSGGIGTPVQTNTGYAGGSGAHRNLQPTLIANKIIKY